MKTVNISPKKLVKLILQITLIVLGLFFLILIAESNTFTENVVTIIFWILIFIALSLFGTYLKRMDKIKK